MRGATAMARKQNLLPFWKSRRSIRHRAQSKWLLRRKGAVNEQKPRLALSIQIRTLPLFLGVTREIDLIGCIRICSPLGSEIASVTVLQLVQKGCLAGVSQP